MFGQAQQQGRMLTAASHALSAALPGVSLAGLAVWDWVCPIYALGRGTVACGTGAAASALPAHPMPHAASEAVAHGRAQPEGGQP